MVQKPWYVREPSESFVPKKIIGLIARKLSSVKKDRWVSSHRVTAVVFDSISIPPDSIT
jgi:hypothetical protein